MNPMWNGMAVGAGAGMLINAVLPAVAGGMKWAAKNAIKGGLMIYAGGKTLAGRATEPLGDMIMEARAEVAAEANTRAMSKKEKAQTKKASPSKA